MLPRQMFNSEMLYQRMRRKTPQSSLMESQFNNVSSILQLQNNLKKNKRQKTNEEDGERSKDGNDSEG